MHTGSEKPYTVWRSKFKNSMAICMPHLFQPRTTLLAASTATLLHALIIVMRHEGWHEWWLLYYFAPITFPFVCFLFDRAETLTNAAEPRWPWLVDLPVLALSITRAFYALPFISGHAFFLSYALLTTRNKPARISAAVVLLEVAYLKIFLWQDATLFGGMAAAGISAALLLGLRKTSK